MMNRKEFEDALMATIVEYISDQVILRYAQACKKATVLFSGALIGYKDAVTSLNELKKDGWTLTAVLSKAAGEVITHQNCQNLRPQHIKKLQQVYFHFFVFVSFFHLSRSFV